MSTPLVSVVIPNHDGRAALERCLASLDAQALRGFETIVVDGGSTDGSTELVRDRVPAVTLVALPENRGFAAAANAGARAARGRYLAILNNDVEVAPGWLAELVACLERHPRAASVSSKVLRAEDRCVLDGAGDAMTLSLKAYRRGQGELDRGRYDVEDEVFSASGTACLWRGDAFRMLGGFDEDFFAYYEDVDLGFRARLLGYDSWYAPRAVAVHLGAGTARRAWREFESLHAVRNRWTMILQDAPRAWLVRQSPRIVLGELMSLARAALVGDLGLVVRAYRETARSSGRWRARRAAVQGSARVGYGELRPLVRRSFPPARGTLWRLRVGSRLRDNSVAGLQTVE